ncbi:hypothetical protein FV227_06015 [Methylobacterium sp. WL119]|uniref:hypothetical protein n=2 Tax=Methylobacterium TaxID=407 RepID=UPI0011C76F2E|nr:hypothetical protein [Methylobacterium sp. WL119]TXN41797.1 hypothetical protein FV225_00930 [Methylobacterium sp. WL93]TXN51889.1 hypothetical protein FV227_06015 [Methylobacterium sp. WL119]
MRTSARPYPARLFFWGNGLELTQSKDVSLRTQIDRDSAVESNASLAAGTWHMPKRVYKDTAVQLALERSYACIDRSRSSADAFYSVMSTSRQAINSSRAILENIAARSVDDSDHTSGADFLSAMEDEAINTMVDDFITAYLEASDTGDEAGAEVIQKALIVVGRFLATKLGPKEAGVLMN